MDAFSHVLDARSIKDKLIIFDYRVVPKTMIIRNSKFVTDKWISWTNWATINMIVDQFAADSFDVKNNIQHSRKEKYERSIKDENVSLEIRFMAAKKPLREFLKLSESYAYYIEVIIKYVHFPAEVDELYSQCASDSYTPESIRKTSSDEGSVKTFSYKPTPKDMITKELKLKAEYIPVALTSDTGQIKYKPSKIEDDLKKSTLVEPYSPKCLQTISQEDNKVISISSAEDSPVFRTAHYRNIAKKYKPDSKYITTSQSHSDDESVISRKDKQKHMNPSSSENENENIEKKDSPDIGAIRKDRSLDLFGASDSEEEKYPSTKVPLQSCTVSPFTRSQEVMALYEKYAEEKKLPAPSTSHSRELLHRKTKTGSSYVETPDETEKKHSKKKKSSKQKDYDAVATTSKSTTDKSGLLHGWLSKASTANESDNNKNGGTKEKKKRKKRVEETLEIDLAELEQQGRDLTEQMKKLKSLNERLQDKDETLPRLEILNLKDRNVKDFINDYGRYQPKLEELFNKYKFVNIKRLENSSDIHHFIAIEICETHQVQAMSSFLYDKFEEDYKDYSEITELLNIKIIPEWCLMLFMDTFHLSREESIERIRLQEQQLMKENQLNWSQSF